MKQKPVFHPAATNTNGPHRRHSRAWARDILAATLALAAAASPGAPATGAPFPLVDGDRQAVIVSGQQEAHEHLSWI
jgi:hypothetical protein